MAGLRVHTAAPSPRETQVQMGIPTTSAFPLWVGLPSPVTANTGPPLFPLCGFIPLCPVSSASATCSWLSGQNPFIGKPIFDRLDGWSVFTLRREAGPRAWHLAQPCLPFCVLPGLPLLPQLPTEPVPPVLRPILQPTLRPCQQPLLLVPLHVHLRPPGGASQCPQPEFGVPGR